MPIYEYYCPHCDQRFELLRAFSRADDEALCPRCQTAGKRLVSAFASFAKGSDGSSTPIGGGSSCGGCSSGSCATCH